MAGDYQVVHVMPKALRISPPRISLLLIAVIVILLDHVTKLAVVNSIALYHKVNLGPFVSLNHIDNAGAAFGLFPNAQFLFLGVAVIVSAYILLAGRKLGSALYVQLILGAILGGALSNAIDRVMQGYVVDYVDFHFWPVFNLADVCIVLGTIAALLFIRTPAPE